MRNQKILIVLAIALVILAACAPVSPASQPGGEDQPKPTQPPTAEVGGEETTTSGVEGQVFIGPVCPVQSSEEDTCQDQPYPARILVLNAEAETIATVETDEQGRFKIALEPGTYTLQPESLDQAGAETEAQGLSLPSSERYPRADPIVVKVDSGEFTQVTILFDSGIR